MPEVLKPLVDAGWLEQQPTSAGEIRGLVGIVDRRLDEVGGSLKHPDSILTLSYDAVRCAATVACVPTAFAPSWLGITK